MNLLNSFIAFPASGGSGIPTADLWDAWEVDSGLSLSGSDVNSWTGINGKVFAWVTGGKPDFASSKVTFTTVGSDQLQLTGSLNYPVTLYFIVEISSTAYILECSANNLFYPRVGLNSSGRLRLRASGGDVNTASSFYTLSSKVILTVTLTTTTGTIRKNDEAEVTLTTTSNFGTGMGSPWLLGRSSATGSTANCAFQAIAVYSKVHNTTEQNAVIQYLKTKYSVF